MEAIKLGACHYLAKPSNTDDIEAAFGRAEGNAEVGLTERPTSIKTLEWERIHETLAATGFNIPETARRLGMHRRTLARKLGKTAGEIARAGARPAGLAGLEGQRSSSAAVASTRRKKHWVRRFPDRPNSGSFLVGCSSYYLIVYAYGSAANSSPAVSPYGGTPPMKSSM